MAVEGTLTLADAYSGSEAILGWLAVQHVDDTGATHLYRFPWTDVPDPIAYEGGFKEARLLDCSWDRPSASVDNQGQWQTATLTAVLSDHDQFFRRQFGNSYQTKMRGSEISLWLIKRSDWVAKNFPVLCWRGVVDTMLPTSPWQVTITAVDILTPLLDRTYPDSFITAADHVGCEDAAIGVPEPIVYGSLGEGHPLWGGECPVILEGVVSTVGVDPTCRRILVCRGTVDIDAVYYTPIDGDPLDPGPQDVTADLGDVSGIYAPGYADWGDTPPGGLTQDYLDIAGVRWTVLYVNAGIWDPLAISKTHKLTVACTDNYVGLDRPSETLRHFLANRVFFQSDTNDDYDGTDPVFSDGFQKLWNTSWDDALTAPDVSCGFMLKDPTPLRQILADAVQCGYVLGLTGSGALTCDSLAITPNTFSSHADTIDIVDRTFAQRARPIWNIYKATYRPDYVDGGYLGAYEDRDAASVTAHGEFPAPETAYNWLRTESDVEDLIDENLTRTATQRWDASMLVAAHHGHHAIDKDRIGSVCPISHKEGTGGIVGYGDYLRAIGLAHIWRLGEQHEQSPTTALDCGAGTVSPGTYAGSPQLGIVGPWGDGSTGLYADGANDSITISPTIATGTTCAFSFWFRPDTLPASETWIIGAATGGITWRNTGKLALIHSSLAYEHTSALTVGQWYHVVLSIVNGVGAEWYINGVSAGSVVPGYPGITISTFLNFPAGSAWFRGGIKDIVFHPGSISAALALVMYQHATLDRSAMGWTARDMMIRRMSWNLRDLATQYDVEEFVTV